MKHSLKTIALVAVPASFALAFAGGTQAAPHQGTAAAAATVRVSDDFYSRSSITIKKNQSISFKWQGTHHKHSVTSNSSPASFSSSLKKGNYSYSHTFSKAGTYSLFCKNHPGTMQLTVKVKKN